MKFIPTTFALLVCCISAVFGQLKDDIEPVCLINGERFNQGQFVGDLLDGCNNCFCGRYGFGCTLMLCLDYQPLDCEIQGQHYNHDASVPSDVCGECHCLNGNLACTNCPALNMASLLFAASLNYSLTYNLQYMIYIYIYIYIYIHKNHIVYCNLFSNEVPTSI
ncbi:unnamed protein product [Lymnaea stagnalis]|uniref:VWFC domain-containing protein n=1 Tax=Lymnaea stagnalis TaxID=6523 RepID=A0AAV2IFZ4_LYMST